MVVVFFLYQLLESWQCQDCSLSLPFSLFANFVALDRRAAGNRRKATYWHLCQLLMNESQIIFFMIDLLRKRLDICPK